MSNTITLQSFLAGKSFVIPAYQRDYSWTPKEVDELFTDLQEALETRTSHYFGTVVLADAGQAFEIVDGQQRLSTIMLMVYALLAQLQPSDRLRIADEVFLLYNNGAGMKLDFGPNQSFVAALLAGQSPIPATGGQRRLEQAYRQCFERARAIRESGGETAIYDYLRTIKALDLIAFSESNPGRAIRMFQSVNDRGRPLSYMDKAKALLVLYSNRFLDGTLDGQINNAFGACFAAYDRVREHASQSGYEIELINRASFSEDEVLRYHYLAYDGPDACDYYGYSQGILDDFLKPALRKRQGDKAALLQFICDYIHDLEAFANAFAALIDSTRSNVRLFTLLIVNRLAARLYPLTIRLFQRDLLFCPISSTTSATDLLHCLEVVDLRVYKLRGTDPARDIGHLSHCSRKATGAKIAAGLRAFVSEFMPDGLMQTQLGQPMYKNGATVPILLAFEQYMAHPHTVEQLASLTEEVPTQEHILAQTPSFDCTGYGFADEVDFQAHVDRLGNIALLSDRENKRCQNKSVQRKMSDQDLYPNSVFAGTRHLAAQFSVTNTVFDKDAMQLRAENLTQFALKRWAIW